MSSLQRLGAKFGAIGALLLACSIARAETPAAPHPGPPDEPPSTRSVSPSDTWLLGDWGGLRTRLFEKGIDFQLVYASEAAYNPVGGAKSLATYTGQVALGATLDLERLIGLPGSRLQVTYTQRAGRNLVDDAGLNTLMLVQEVYGRGQTTRLTQLWLEHRLLGGVIDWKWGRMAVGGDFAVFPCDFQNLTFCGSNPGNLVGGYIYNWPISQWGTRVKVALQGFGYFQVGAYDQNEQYLGYTNKLLPVWYPDSTGVLVPVEIAWLPTFGNGRLPGSYKIGAWYSSTQANDVTLDVDGNLAALTGEPALQHRGLYGGYLTFQQQVTRNGSDHPHGGLRLFLNAVIADSATSVTDHQIAGGFTYTGPFGSRPHDVVGFAAGTTHVNNRVTDLQNLQNALGLGPTSVKNSEYVLELYYTIAAVPGLLVRPNLQYVFTPWGTDENKDILVLGLKSVISF